MRHLSAAVFAVLAAATAAASAQVAVSDAWVRGTVEGQSATGAFMQLRSADGTVLVGVASPVAGTAEIHEMRMDGAVMRMRPVPKVDLPAGRTVELKPGGYHVMLMNLKAPLKKGDTVPIMLKLQGWDGKPRELEVKAEVRDLTAARGGQHKH